MKKMEFKYRLGNTSIKLQNLIAQTSFKNECSRYDSQENIVCKN